MEPECSETERSDRAEVREPDCVAAACHDCKIKGMGGDVEGMRKRNAAEWRNGARQKIRVVETGLKRSEAEPERKPILRSEGTRPGKDILV